MKIDENGYTTKFEGLDRILSMQQAGDISNENANRLILNLLKSSLPLVSTDSELENSFQEEFADLIWCLIDSYIKMDTEWSSDIHDELMKKFQEIQLDKGSQS